MVERPGANETRAAAAKAVRDALSATELEWDEPSDQVWCTIASGYAGNTFLGTRTACEADEF